MSIFKMKMSFEHGKVARGTIREVACHQVIRVNYLSQRVANSGNHVPLAGDKINEFEKFFVKKNIHAFRGKTSEAAQEEHIMWKSYKRQETTPPQSDSFPDMTNTRSCHHSMNIPVMFWTSVFLLLLARGVCCTEEQSKFERFSKFEPETDVDGYSTPDSQDTYNVMNVLRELIQRHQQKGTQQIQVYNNGEDLSESQPEWKKVPLPLLYQIRAIINDGKEKDKRGSYMLPCHFKVCNLG